MINKNLVKSSKTKIYFLLVILILTIPVFQFLVNSKYSFPEPHPFKGDYIYNPYEGIDSKKWGMANFHAHTRMLFGLTAGHRNSDQSLDSLYRYFNYKIISISNYQAINKFESRNSWFIPVYEHGYQYYKNHQLVINAKKVSWLDFFFRQTLHNKQSIIDHIKKDTSVIISIVHPGPRKAYPVNDFKYLSNYDYLEIASDLGALTSYYDTILSAGHPVFLMANDDTHDLKKLNNVCHSFNLINTDLIKDSVLHSIKAGRLVGVNLNVSQFETNEEKKSKLSALPEITGVTLKDDTFVISLNKLVKTIKFVGQKGAEKMKFTDTATGSYFFNKQDTYIRTEIECYDGTMYFLNPVFRYDGTKLPYNGSSLSLFKTWLSRSVIIAALILLFIIMRIIKKT